MILYLIRHGETDWNRLGKIQGQADNPLNENGIQQAREAAGYIRKLPYTDVYSSPLKRAVQTAMIVTGLPEKSITADPRLTEISYGKDEGVSILLIMTDQNLKLHNYFLKPGAYEPPEDGETISHLKQRCRDFLEEMDRKYLPEDKILISAHGALIRGMISVADDLPDSAFWTGEEQKNCSVTEICFHEGRGKLLRDAVPADQL